MADAVLGLAAGYLLGRRQPNLFQEKEVIVNYCHTGFAITILGYGFEISLGYCEWREPGRCYRFIFPWTHTRWFFWMTNVVEPEDTTDAVL
jgi:hypothetical protein